MFLLHRDQKLLRGGDHVVGSKSRGGRTGRVVVAPGVKAWNLESAGEIYRIVIAGGQQLLFEGGLTGLTIAAGAKQTRPAAAATAQTAGGITGMSPLVWKSRGTWRNRRVWV